MKKLISILIVLVAITVSCSDKNKKKEITEQNDDTQIEKKDEIDRNREITILDTIKWHDKIYYTEIQRMPVGDSAGIIKDEMGDLYADNTISLKISCNGKLFLKRKLEKSTFKNHMPKGFYNKYRFNGMVFDKITTEGIQFAASVGSPSLEEEFIPFLVIVSSTGNLTIKKDNSLDAIGEDENNY